MIRSTITLRMISHHVRNFQVTLLQGSDRYIAATRFEEADANLVFFCWDRMVHRQPKDEMQSFRELRCGEPVTLQSVKAMG